MLVCCVFVVLLLVAVLSCFCVAFELNVVVDVFWYCALFSVCYWRWFVVVCCCFFVRILLFVYVVLLRLFCRCARALFVLLCVL